MSELHHPVPVATQEARGNQGHYPCRCLGPRVKKTEHGESVVQSEKIGLQGKNQLWGDNGFITR